MYLALGGSVLPLLARQTSRSALVLGTAAVALLPSAVSSTGSAVSSWWIVLAGAVVAAVLMVLARPNLRPTITPAIGAALTGLWLRSGDYGVPRLSAYVVGAVAIVILLSAIRQSKGRVRGWLEIASVFLAALLTLGVVNTAVTLLSARSDIEAAATSLEAGLNTTDVEDVASAQEALVVARSRLSSARHQLASRWATPAQYVPVVSQNFAALEESVVAIDRSVIAAARAVEAADVSDFRSETGGLDLAQIASAEAAAQQFRQSLVTITEVQAKHRGPWVVAPLVTRLQTAATKANETISEIDQQLPYLAQLPSLLGADSPRRYLVLAANPNETRELGGFLGGYALIEFDSGALQLIDSGRATDLNEQPATPSTVESLLPDRFASYEPWKYSQNFTGTHDLGVAAAVIRDIYNEMGSGPANDGAIDGVIYLDPYALGAITELSGPVEVEAIGLNLDQDSLPEFLLTGQYELIDDRYARTSVLDVVLASVFSQLQASDLPPLETIVDTLKPVIDQGRLRMVSFDEADNQLLASFGLAQRFRPAAFDDFLSVSHANGGPNKLDAYLHRTIDYDLSIDEDSTGPGERPTAQAALSITLDNRAPLGLNDYVTPNRHGLEPGTNRLLLIVHSPLELDVASQRGEIVEASSYFEYGMWRHELFVAVPQGRSVEVLFEMSGVLGAAAQDADPSKHELWVHHQPTATTDSYAVTVDGTRKDFDLTTSIMAEWGR